MTRVVKADAKNYNPWWSAFAWSLAFLIVFTVVGLLLSKRRHESARCISHMFAIMTAARFWAHEHRSQLPPDWLTMANELRSPKILHCPADHSRTTIRSWTDFDENVSSYEILSTNALSGVKNSPYFRCRIHGNVGYADASIFDGKATHYGELLLPKAIP
jgi:hypothetical protein